MSSSNNLDTTTLILLVIGAIVVVPLLTMGLGFGGMMGYGGMMGGAGTYGGWWPLLWMLVPLTLFVGILGGGYLLFRRVAEGRSGRTAAMEELRMAYARGDITDEEYESRRETLEGSE